MSLELEILLYRLSFKDNKSAEKFCQHWQTDVVHGRFVYQGQEFTVPEIPPTHQFVADISESDTPGFPVRVDILVAKKG